MLKFKNKKFKIFCFVIAIFMMLSSMTYTVLAADTEKTDILEELGLYENEYILITEETMTIDEMNALLGERAVSAEENIAYLHENAEYSIAAEAQCPGGNHPGYNSSSYYGHTKVYTRSKNDYCWYEWAYYTQSCKASGCDYNFPMYGKTGSYGLHSMVTLTNPNGQVVGYICSNSNCLISLI